MRTAGICLIICLCATFCKKQKTESSISSTTSQTINTATKPTDPSSITVTVNDATMQVTSIHYSRGGAEFDFSAQNSLQKVDVYCFHFYGQSGFNYQYSDSIKYCIRPDTLTSWYAKRAIDWGHVDFNCCAFPLADARIEGSFSGDFSNDKKPLTVKGTFILNW